MSPRRRTTFFITISLLFAFMASAPAIASGRQLKVNLVIDDNTFMVYAGDADGVKVGDKYTITRVGTIIGTAEVTKVEKTYSIMKTTQKSIQVRELDEVVRPTGDVPATSAPKSTETTKKAPEKSAPAKTEPKKEEKKAEPKKTEDKPKTAAAPKKQETAPTAAKPAEEKKEAPTPAAPKAKVPLVYSTYPSEYGPTGLLQVPSAEIVEKNKGGIAFFSMHNSASTGGGTQGPIDVNSYYYIFTKRLDRTSFSAVYGIDRRFEIGLASMRLKTSAYINYTDYFLSAYGNVHETIRENIISVKFNPRRRGLLLQPNTVKKFQYAIGLMRVNFSSGLSDRTIVYGAGTFPVGKFKAHISPYAVQGSRINGNHFGTMAGIEAPVGRRLAFISDINIFQGMETATLGARYYINDQAQATLGFYDFTDEPYTMLNIGYRF